MKHVNVRLVITKQFQSPWHYDNFVEKCKMLNIKPSYRQLRKLRNERGLVWNKT